MSTTDPVLTYSWADSSGWSSPRPEYDYSRDGEHALGWYKYFVHRGVAPEALEECGTFSEMVVAAVDYLARPEVLPATGRLQRPHVCAHCGAGVKDPGRVKCEQCGAPLRSEG